MIKFFLHKITSIALAFVVLFSTLSFTVEKHFCGNTLIDVSIFTEAKKCEMEAAEIELEKITKKPCCKDVIEVIEGQDELKFSSFEDFNIGNQLFLASLAFSYANLFESFPKQIIPHKDYSPPNLVVDIQLLDAVFLI